MAAVGGKRGGDTGSVGRAEAVVMGAAAVLVGCDEEEADAFDGGGA